MREYITTLGEVIGATSLSVGVGLCFGLGAGLIAAGVLILTGSILLGMVVTE